MKSSCSVAVNKDQRNAVAASLPCRFATGGVWLWLVLMLCLSSRERKTFLCTVKWEYFTVKPSKIGSLVVVRRVVDVIFGRLTSVDVLRHKMTVFFSRASFCMLSCSLYLFY